MTSCRPRLAVFAVRFETNTPSWVVQPDTGGAGERSSLAKITSQPARADKLPAIIPRRLTVPDLTPESGSPRQKRRQDLLRLILDPRAQSRRGLAPLAAEAQWPLPATVTLVAARTPGGLAPGAGDSPVASGTATAATATATAAGTALGRRDILCDRTGPDTCLLVPGEITRPDGVALAGALADRRLSVGLTVPLSAAADSLRWARRALSLAETGAIDAGRLIWCEDHLVTLWLLSDPRLADHVIRQQLGPLADLTPRQRTRVLDTLAPWLEKRGTATEIAELLHVHPQTVRYRIRQIERTFGARLADPDSRFTLELVLRVLRLRQRQAPPRPRRPPRAEPGEG